MLSKAWFNYLVHWLWRSMYHVCKIAHVIHIIIVTTFLSHYTYTHCILGIISFMCTFTHYTWYCRRYVHIYTLYKIHTIALVHIVVIIKFGTIKIFGLYKWLKVRMNSRIQCFSLTIKISTTFIYSAIHKILYTFNVWTFS